MSEDQVKVEFVSAVFPNTYEARASFNDLVKRHESGSIELLDVAVMVRGFSGKLSLTDQVALTPAEGAERGALLGAAIGVLFPPSLLAGAAMGAVAGALTGKASTRGFQDDLLHDIAEGLGSGQSAVLVVAEPQWKLSIIEALDGCDRLIERTFSASDAGDIFDAG